MSVIELPTPDRVWFQKHPGHNVRIRRPLRGEIEEICRRSVPGAGYAIAQLGLPPLPDESEYRVVVIDEFGHTLLRLVTMAAASSPLEIDGHVAPGRWRCCSARASQSIAGLDRV